MGAGYGAFYGLGMNKKKCTHSFEKRTEKTVTERKGNIIIL